MTKEIPKETIDLYTEQLHEELENVEVEGVIEPTKWQTEFILWLS